MTHQSEDGNCQARHTKEQKYGQRRSETTSNGGPPETAHQDRQGDILEEARQVPSYDSSKLTTLLHPGHKITKGDPSQTAKWNTKVQCRLKHVKTYPKSSRTNN